MGVGKNILLVEDDKVLADAVSEYLSNEGFSISVIDNGSAAIPEIINTQPDLVILDIMLPGKDGLTVCKEVRPEYAGYIIMFTAREDEIDQIVGLELGADDYLIKPVKPRLLLAKVKAFLRRDTQVTSAQKIPTQLEFGSLKINLDERSVILSGKEITFTSAEFDLLAILARQAGTVLSRDEITRQLSGGHYDGLDRTIDNKISLLRKKLGDDSTTPTRIKTVRLKGYVLIPGAWSTSY
ncbi:MAG: response regulator [Candidatus Thiodiazotropha sp. L084R]